MTGFPDHFSERAADYAAFRPSYPEALFDWLASIAPGRALAWDCATGSGQAVPGLAARFDRVIATDASAAQIGNARPLPNVEFRVALAESSGLPDRSVDLVTVAQALHWLDHPAFFAEVGRVAKRGGVLAAWMYNVIEVMPGFDEALRRFYSETVGPFWPGNRAYVDQGYRTIAMPFREVTAPPFAMEARWTLGHLLGYLRTWSAVGRYVAARGHDPVEAVAGELTTFWGDPGTVRPVRWPLAFRVGIVPG